MFTKRHIVAINGSCYGPCMPKSKPEDEKAGSWVFRDIPRELMHKMKVAAAVKRKSVKQLLVPPRYRVT